MLSSEFDRIQCSLHRARSPGRAVRRTGGADVSLGVPRMSLLMSRFGHARRVRVMREMRRRIREARRHVPAVDPPKCAPGLTCPPTDAEKEPTRR